MDGHTDARNDGLKYSDFSADPRGPVLLNLLILRLLSKTIVCVCVRVCVCVCVCVCDATSTACTAHQTRI